MLFFRHHLEVGDVVVSGVLIAMVDNLFRRQEPTEMLLHNQAMFHHVPFGISERVMRSEDRQVTIVPTVSNSSLKGWMGFAANIFALPLPLAFRRAESLGAFPRADSRAAADGAHAFDRSAPSLRKVAAARTKTRGFLAAIFRMEALPAGVTSQRHSGSFHSRIIPRKERYCEIAAKRMSQSVLPLEMANGH